MSRSTVTIFRALADTNISETSKKPAQSLPAYQSPSLRPQSNRDTSNVAAEKPSPAAIPQSAFAGCKPLRTLMQSTPGYAPFATKQAL